MQVSLNITGDASGAKQALQDASAGVTDLAKNAAVSTSAVEAGFNKANEAAAKMAQSAQTAGAANDNSAGAAQGLADQLSAVAQQALGSNSALAKAASGAVSFASGVGNLIKAASTVALLSAGLGIAVTVATTFFGIINTGSSAASQALEEQTRILGVVRAAYSDATKSAGEFLTQSKNITLFEAQQNLTAIQKSVGTAANTVLGAVSPKSTGGFNGALPGELGFGSDIASSVIPPDASTQTSAYQDAIDKLRQSITAGTNDLSAFRETMVAIAQASAASDPALASLATSANSVARAYQPLITALTLAKNNVAILSGTANDLQKKQNGVATAADANSGAFDRLSKSMDRQSASQVAESQTAGQAAGVSAQLRAQFILTEAAQQSGAGTAQKYADKIAAIAQRAGEAAQKLAEAKLQSDTAFNTSQLGRNTIDASVADQLKGTFGNDADQNSALANAIRFNEQMKDLKGTVTDISNGAFTDFRTAVQGGATAMTALGTAAENALNKIIDKLGNKILDNGISQLFGAFTGTGGTVANGGIVLGTPSGPGTFEVGGFTGVGGKFEPAGTVHKGEYVFDAESTQAAGVGFLDNMRKRLRGYSSGGLVGPGGPYSPSGSGSGGGIAFNVSVENHNNSDVAVQQQKNSSGGMDVKVMVKQAVDQNIASGGHDKALGGRYGLKPAIGAR